MNSFGANADTALLELPHAGSIYEYSVYGIQVRSRIRLTIPDAPFAGHADIDVLAGESAMFSDALHKVGLHSSHWFHNHELPSGWSYIRCDEWFEFLVSPDGDRIFCHLLGPVSIESFQTYLLGRVFAHALVKSGQEPLHASAVVVDGNAIAFLGSSTFGKSSLAACFVGAGHSLLTDDVLRLQEERGRLLAHPGPPRLKLFPKLARLFLGESASGESVNPRAAKRVFPLSATQSCSAPFPLAAIYVVTAPRNVRRKQRITVQSSTQSDALIDLLSYTHDHVVVNSARLERQFLAAKRVIDTVPVRTLAYPRVLESLPEVRDAILTDLERSEP